MKPTCAPFIAASAISIAACVPALAADNTCRTIHDSMMSTLNSPQGFRQFISRGDGAAEQVISVVTRDAVYLPLGTHWNRKPRAEVRSIGLEAEGSRQYSECRLAGSAILEGERVSVFEYRVRIEGLPALPAKAWIGADGRLRKQSSGTHGYIRYEYKDVHAPA
jgi:hypothetical protein